MSQLLVTLKYISKVCNFRYSLTVSIPLLKHLSTFPALFEPNFQNPSDCDGVNDKINSGFYAESEYNAKCQFTGGFVDQVFNQTLGVQCVEDHRNENLNGPGGKNGDVLGGYRQENSRSVFRNDIDGFSREGRVNESRLSGYYRHNSGEFMQQTGVFNNSLSSLSGVLDAQNQFNGNYGQNAMHSQQSSGYYSVGNVNYVGNAQQGTHKKFHGNNWNVVGSHQHSENSYHGNYANSLEGNPIGNVGEYQQNLSVYRTNAGPQSLTTEYQNDIDGFQVAGNSSTVEASEKRTVEEINDLCNEGKLKEAIELLVLLEQQGNPIGMDRYFLLMKACGEAQALEEAKYVHDLFIRRNFPYEVRSFNNILEMYCICGSMDDAYGVFNKMPQRNLTSWDTLIL